MLDWIGKNPLVFTGICSIVVAFIASFTTLTIERKKGVNNIIAKLEQENKELKIEVVSLTENLTEMISIQKSEENIDKAFGTIYFEKLPDGKKREICGNCWETSHLKIPVLTVPTAKEADLKLSQCDVCGKNCMWRKENAKPIELQRDSGL